jgi:Arc/MetJ-type ribon-helix-helix transcriptional regulator
MSIMTETIPVRLDRETVDTLDLLVKTGLYRNRSEAIRELMKRGLDSKEELKKLGKLVKLIQTMDSNGKLDFAGVRLDREFR